MRRGLMLAIALVFGLCAPLRAEFDCSNLKRVPPRCIGLHVWGGIAGLNQWVIVDSAGNVCKSTPKTSSHFRISAARLASLRSAFHSSGFFSWQPGKSSHAPMDAMFRQIVYDDGKQRHEVTLVDPATAPAGFGELAAALQSLEAKPYSHASDLSWICGKLQHSALEGGFWTITYQRDGEKVVLILPANGMPASLHDGDMVVATGLVQKDTMGLAMAGTYYKVTSIDRLSP